MERTREVYMAAVNKKAAHDYFIEETLECGVELWGNEVKSIKDGNVSIKEAWVSIDNGQMYLKNCHISKWRKANAFDVDEKRDKKLLAHKKEINDLYKKVQVQGYTLVPLKVYVKKGLCKVEVALCRGKHNYDKRESLKKKDMQREMERAR